jgi:hypothetical protein
MKQRDAVAQMLQAALNAVDNARSRVIQSLVPRLNQVSEPVPQLLLADPGETVLQAVKMGAVPTQYVHLSQRDPFRNILFYRRHQFRRCRWCRSAGIRRQVT